MPDHSPSQREGPYLDPREAVRRHRQRQGPSAGLVYLHAIAAEERQWLEKLVVRAAAEYHVDRDDLLQDVYASLLTCTEIDPTRNGLRAWLTRRVRWKAADLCRNAARHRAQALDDTADPPAVPSTHVDVDWDVDPSWRLSRDEAQIVRLLCWGVDLSMQEFGRLVKRSYAKTRQDRSRGLRKIQELFGLTTEERDAFIAFRQFPTYPDAALQLGLSEDELRARVRRAEAKIERVLTRSTSDVDAEGEGGDPDDR